MKKLFKKEFLKYSIAAVIVFSSIAYFIKTTKFDDLFAVLIIVSIVWFLGNFITYFNKK